MASASPRRSPLSVICKANVVMAGQVPGFPGGKVKRGCLGRAGAQIIHAVSPSKGCGNPRVAGRGTPIDLMGNSVAASLSPPRENPNSPRIWGTGPEKTKVFKARVVKHILNPSKIFEVDPTPVTQFRRYYERGDLPIAVRHGAKMGLVWKVNPEKLDYQYFMPIFMTGLTEKKDPFDFLAYSATLQMIERGGDHVPAALPAMILPFKNALNTKDPPIICKVLALLQAILKCHPSTGPAFVPYYRQLLPVFNLFKSKNMNIGDTIEYSQRFNRNLGDLIKDTLHLFERFGGEDAFINIKYMIPTYESNAPFLNAVVVNEELSQQEKVKLMKEEAKQKKEAKPKA